MSIPPSAAPGGGAIRRDVGMEVSFTDRGLLFDADLHDRWISPEGDGQVDIHHYRMSVTASFPDLVVTSIAVKPLVLPYQECPTAIDAAQDLVGARLGRELNERAGVALGSARGCSHLLALVRSVCSWYWIHGGLLSLDSVLDRQPPDRAVAERLVDSCVGWREGSSAITFARSDTPSGPRWLAK